MAHHHTELGASRQRKAARFGIFTIVIKSFSGGPSSNQMEDANTKDGRVEYESGLCFASGAPVVGAKK